MGGYLKFLKYRLKSNVSVQKVNLYPSLIFLVDSPIKGFFQDPGQGGKERIDESDQFSDEIILGLIEFVKRGISVFGFEYFAMARMLNVHDYYVSFIVMRD